MARYIDAERLKRTFASGIRVYDGMCKIDDVLHNIENAPTTEVEEVVRCKDCKERYQYEEFDRDTGEMVECNSCFKFHRDFGDNGFCSYGERRDT